MTIKSVARNTLFGNTKTKHPLLQTILTDLGRAGMTLLDAKPRDYATHLAMLEALQHATVGLTRAVQNWRNSRTKAGVPMALFNAVNDVLLHRGGLTHEQPNFYCVRAGSFENQLLYSIPIGYHKWAKIDALSSFELALEDRLCHTHGSNINVRVCFKPTRIEIDKPRIPTFRLADYWQDIQRLPVGGRVAVPGVAIGQSGIDLAQVALTNDSFAVFIVANSGYGKTQLAMSMVLSLALLNSPSDLSMFIADNKADDWMPFSKLPHMARPVITEAADLLEVARSLVGEMDNRKQSSMADDRSFKGQTILLYIDELSDVFAELEAAQAKELAGLLQRLSQRGRSAGFIIIAATQRVHDLKGYAEAYSKLRLRIAGNTTSNNDAASIVGPGVQLSKLPVGAFEIHNNGNVQRIQGFLVADSRRDDYTKQVRVFVGDVAERWPGIAPHYGQNAIRAVVVAGERTIEAFLDHLGTIDGLTQNRIIREHRAYFGTGIGVVRARQIMAMMDNDGCSEGAPGI